MNFKEPDEYRYTEDNPYVSTGLNRNTVKGKEYIGAWGDVAEFNDLFMRGKNGLDIDEFVPSSCYIARKNYIDLLDVEKQEVKLVGNTIKSKKMPIYIEKFVDSTVRDLLMNRGYEYLEKYYDMIEKIYNLRIPLKDIATLGKIKISLDEYKKNCNMRTKSGTKKARQAWYELAIKHNLDVRMGDTVYYINTGTKKNDSDVKRVTHYYEYRNGEKVDVTKELKKEYAKLKKDAKLGLKDAIEKLNDKSTSKQMNLDTYVGKYYPAVIDEDELIFNCVMLPNEIVEDEEDHFCNDEFEYNVEKYISMFNNRIKPQLVCFDKKIRTKYVTNKKGEIVEENNILITNPKHRKHFTREEAMEVCGQPYNESDQDTYEQLMTMEDKEIKFWISVNKTPVYVDECGMDWESIKSDYLSRIETLKQDGIKEEHALYQKHISKVTQSEVDELITEGRIPDRILSICDFDPHNGALISKVWSVKLGDIYDILDKNFDGVDDDEDEQNPMYTVNNE